MVIVVFFVCVFPVFRNDFFVVSGFVDAVIYFYSYYSVVLSNTHTHKLHSVCETAHKNINIKLELNECQR